MQDPASFNLDAIKKKIEEVIKHHEGEEEESIFTISLKCRVALKGRLPNVLNVKSPRPSPPRRPAIFSQRKEKWEVTHPAIACSELT